MWKMIESNLLPRRERARQARRDEPASKSNRGTETQKSRIERRSALTQRHVSRTEALHYRDVGGEGWVGGNNIVAKLYDTTAGERAELHVGPEGAVELNDDVGEQAIRPTLSISCGSSPARSLLSAWLLGASCA